MPKEEYAKNKFEEVLEEYKEGTLKSGGSKKKVKNRKQALAIAFSESRKKNKKRNSK